MSPTTAAMLFALVGIMLLLSHMVLDHGYFGVN